MLVNVNTRYGNSARVADALRRFSPDIVVLEEVSTKWLSDLGPVLASYEHSSQEPREDNFGIALFSRFPFTQSGVAYIGDAEVPSIVAEIETGQGKCTVLATHPLPPAGREYSRLRNGQLAQLPRYVHRAASPVLLLGDLNVSPWSPYFRRLLRESGLRDSAQGRGVRPTWPTFNPLMLIPIDHCLYSPGIAIVNRQTGPHVGSDHFPVVVDFVIRANGMGEANHAWKNNDFAASVALLPKLVAELKQPRYLHAGDQRLVRNEMLPFDNDPRLSIQRDVVYGKTVPEVQRLDAYLVKSEQPTPVLIEFHGGGWETDTKGQTNN
jgi:endonuclease/exonuclease/phosphatase family metal-dependent hydrolase